MEWEISLDGMGDIVKSCSLRRQPPAAHFYPPVCFLFLAVKLLALMSFCVVY